MYGRDEETAKDNIEGRTDELVTYLSHCKKSEHVTTVMELSRRLAIAERAANDAKRNESFNDRLAKDMMYEQRPDRPRTIEIPTNARSVEVKF